MLESWKLPLRCGGPWSKQSALLLNTAIDLNVLQFKPVEEGCDELASHVKSKEPNLHVLVNNSLTTWGRRWPEFPETGGWDRVMNLTVETIFYLADALSSFLAPSFISRRIINISAVN